jgi:NitT/TauT family transport system permease protein
MRYLRKQEKTLNREIQKRWIQIFWVLVLLGLWQGTYWFGGISPLLLPGPAQVLETLWDSLMRGDLAYQIGYSLTIIIAGILSAVLLGIFMALASQHSMMLEGLVKVLSVMGHPLPALALLPLIIIWFGTGDLSILVIIVHSALWPILINLRAGFEEVPPIYLDVGKNLELSALSIAMEIKMKFALPYLLSGIRIAFARSWRALIGAEMVFGAIGLKGGIGWFIFKQRTFMNTPGLFAGILVVILLGFLVETLLFNWIEKKTIGKWNPKKG